LSSFLYNLWVNNTMVRATIDLGCIIKKTPTAGGCWGKEENV
jgi:hypothetical protein